MPRTYPAFGAPCRIPAANAFPRRSGFQHVPRGAFHRQCSALCQPTGARMPAAIGLECFPSIPWISPFVLAASALLRSACQCWVAVDRSGGCVSTTYACWRWHRAMGAARCDFRPFCGECPGVMFPMSSADAGGAPGNGFRPAAPASARGYGPRCQ